MAASFTIADRNNGFTKADTPAATLVSMAAYREAMADFAAMARWTSGMPTWTRTSPYRGPAVQRRQTNVLLGRHHSDGTRIPR